MQQTVEQQAHRPYHPSIILFYHCKPEVGAEDTAGCVHNPHGDPLFGAPPAAGDVGTPTPPYSAVELVAVDDAATSYSVPGATCWRPGTSPSSLRGTMSTFGPSVAGAGSAKTLPLASPPKLDDASGSISGPMEAPALPSPIELKPRPGSPIWSDHGPVLSEESGCV